MSENIIKTTYKDKEIYLVKTAHVSKNSVEDVKKCVADVNPDCIAIELDEDRYNKLMNPSNWENTDIVSIIKEDKVGFLLVNIILSSFQRRMAINMDSSSGAEMLEGAKIANEKNLELVLADRSVRTTFSRIWRKLGIGEKGKLLATIISSLFDKEELSEEDLQNLKESDALEAALKDVAKEFPVMKNILVDERDKYLAEKIKNAKGKKIVAIVGAAHANGIISHLNEDINLAELEDTTKKKGIGTFVAWAIPIIIVGLIIATIIINKDSGLEQIKIWILWNGTLSALGVALALGHPLAILTAFVAAPITSLNPLLAAGWFAGIVQAMISKPRVSDLEKLGEDTNTIKGFWKNRLTKVLLVVVFANVFSSIATIISGLEIFKNFINLLH